MICSFHVIVAIFGIVLVNADCRFSLNNSLLLYYVYIVVFGCIQ